MKTVAEYNQRELRARGALSPEGEAFYSWSKLFAVQAAEGEISFDVKRALNNPADEEPESFFTRVLHALTPEEFDAHQSITAQVIDFSERQCGEVCFAPTAVLKAIHLWRVLRDVSGATAPKILEILPASPYLSALNSLCTMTHTLVEFRPAQYVFQRRLFESTIPGLYVNIDDDNCRVVGPRTEQEGCLAHAPWWRLESILEYYLPEAECIILNALLLREEHDALTEVLKALRALSDRRGPRPVIVSLFRDLPSDEQLRVVLQLREYGHELVYLDGLSAVFSKSLGSPASLSDTEWLIQGELYCKDDHPIGKLVAAHEEIDIEWRNIPYEQLDTMYTLLRGSSANI